MLFVYGTFWSNLKKSLQVKRKPMISPLRKERAGLSAFKDNDLLKSTNYVSGSMTVEAAVVIPIFLIVIFGVLRFFALINFQNLLMIDMCDTAMQLGVIQYSTDSEQKLDDIYGAQKILFGKAGDAAEKAGIIGGRYGIILTNSDINEESTIKTIQADYAWNTNVGVSNYKWYFKLSQRCSYISWNGKSIVSDDLVDKKTYVYITENGTVYHTMMECTYLTRMVQTIGISEIDSIRNLSGGKYKPCEQCCKNTVLSKNVFITGYGDRYHCNSQCSSLKRYIKKVDLDEVKGMRKCIKCSNKEK